MGYEHRNEKEVRLRSGITIPAGDGTVTFDGRPDTCILEYLGLQYRIRIRSAFEVPDMDTLEAWTSEGVCESVAGHNVEPDGFDVEESPSWLLALGLI